MRRNKTRNTKKILLKRAQLQKINKRVHFQNFEQVSEFVWKHLCSSNRRIKKLENQIHKKDEEIDILYNNINFIAKKLCGIEKILGIETTYKGYRLVPSTDV